MKPRVPLFVVALLIGASTWTMHRSTSADAEAGRAPEPAVRVMPLANTDSSPAARPASYSAASVDLIAARAQTP